VPRAHGQEPSNEAPHAIGQSNGTIDVFWGGGGGQLYHDCTTGGCWHGWEAKGGALALDPSPVLTGSGHYAVLLKGTDGNLREGKWEGAWSGPINLGSGPLGPPPAATAQSNGNINVFWRGTSLSDAWSDRYSPSGGWSRPARFGE
jgi:hypothetical protein